MLDRIIKMIEQKLECPHCNIELTLCHAPPVHVGDGLGWGSEHLFVCLNDDCSLFADGWEYIENQYGHVGSYRYMRLPDSNESFNMMVAGKAAFTGSIVDIEEIKKQDKRLQQGKKALAELDSCVAEKNLEPVLCLLLDDHANIHDRKKAASLLVELNDISCIEPLRNHSYKDSHMEQAVDMSIHSILKAHFLKECPFCAELVKARSTFCKHCQKEFK